MRTGRGEDPPETIEANSTTIRRVENEQWEDAVEATRTAEGTSAAPDSLPKILQEESDTRLSTRHYSFYVFETEAREAPRALKITTGLGHHSGEAQFHSRRLAIRERYDG